MTIDQISLGALPYYLAVTTFAAFVVCLGFGIAFAARKLSRTLKRTSEVAMRNINVLQPSSTQSTGPTSLTKRIS
ncbi:hypothetical protein ACFPOB_29870 [Bosea eneae]|uniref:Heme exporter protein D n=1 Tax=Bosea eneae TaxID=151454 RepID=A0ABW0IZL5_9HYPH